MMTNWWWTFFHCLIYYPVYFSWENIQCLFFILSEPYAEYKIWIKAYTAKNEGKSSEPIVVLTDVRAPGAPLVVNLTCQNGNTLFLKWIRPTLYYRTVDVYNVHYRPEENDNWEIQVVETVNNTINHMVSQGRGLHSICNGWLRQMRKCKQPMTTTAMSKQGVISRGAKQILTKITFSFNKSWRPQRLKQLENQNSCHGSTFW